MGIHINNLTISYRNRPAVHHLDISFQHNEMWAIFGPNGAGKSTLLKGIVGLLKPDTGTIVFDQLTRNQIAYLPQQSEIDRSQPMSVYELTAMGLWYEIGFFGGVRATQHQRIQAALATVEMLDFAKRPISQLSNGQFQRVLFARMLVQDAKFLLLDEPFNAVDAKTTYLLLKILSRYHTENHCSIIAVLHDYEQVHAYFPKTLLLAKEKIIAGKTEQVLTESWLERANQFMQQQESDDWCTV